MKLESMTWLATICIEEANCIIRIIIAINDMYQNCGAVKHIDTGAEFQAAVYTLQ